MIPKKLFPNSKIGIMGAGQLCRMFAVEAIQKGYEVYSYSPEIDSPASKIGVKSFVGEYEDEKKLISFLEKIDALSFEFENIPEKSLEIISEYSKTKIDFHVSPSIESIKISQNRNIEKSFFNKINLPTTDFYYIDSIISLEQISDKLSFPCILKTNRFGYDGKGQGKFYSYNELYDYLIKQKYIEHIIEKIVPFDIEISVIGARFYSGKKLCFNSSQNIHKNHILDLTIHPANISKELSYRALEYTNILLDSLNYVGVLGLEFFVTGENLICNEFAPRPHNSGHFSQNASEISQFDLQLMTLTNIEPELESLESKKSIMKNLVGYEFQKHNKFYNSLFSKPNYYYHDYQKVEEREGRKMGHFNYIGNLEYQKAFPL